MTIFELLKDGGRALLDALFPRRQALANLRAKWGQPGDKAHGGISRCFDVDGWFDYRLRAGRTDRRNAIQLLARNGFPADLVADALAYAHTYASSAHPRPTPAPVILDTTAGADGHSIP